ncbi:MAG: hypothetical protein QM658_01945 [Gordonia sp. (in: high G+C Gram-positive bacteria)]
MTKPRASGRWIAPRGGGYRPGGELTKKTGTKAGTSKAAAPEGTAGVVVNKRQ